MLGIKFFLAPEYLARNRADPEIVLHQLIALHEPAVRELRNAIGVFECRRWHCDVDAEESWNVKIVAFEQQYSSRLHDGIMV